MTKTEPQYLLRYDMRMDADSEDAEIMVYGEIVDSRWDDDGADMTAKDFDTMLKSAKAKGARRLNLRINSPGGAVWQAAAMRAMLMESGLSLTVNIEGLCASAATLLACVPGAKVRMHGGSMYMIHNPHSLVMGDAAYLEHEAAMLRKSEEEIAAIYALRTGMAVTDIRELMDDETWFTAADAVAFGFADEAVDDMDMAASVSAADLQTMHTIYAHVPDSIQQTEASTGSTPAATAEPSEIQVTEEVLTMDIHEYTAEQLNAENPELYASIVAAAVTQERQRVQDIDDLTMPGYEALATEAKQSGMSALDYHKLLVKTQREQGEKYMASRRVETQPAASVGNGNPHADEQADEERAIRDIADYARAYSSETGDMF